MQAIELSAQITKSHEIHLKLPDHIRAGHAKVIIMYDTDRPVPKPRVFGQFKQQIQIQADFDDALPEQFWLDSSE